MQKQRSLISCVQVQRPSQILLLTYVSYKRWGTSLAFVNQTAASANSDPERRRRRRRRTHHPSLVEQRVLISSWLAQMQWLNKKWYRI